MHAEDAVVQTQPLMVWYAAEPTAELDMTRALAFETAAVVLVHRSSTRLLDTPKALRLLADRLGHTDNMAQQLDPVNRLIVKKP
jgi:hypothetical protein